MEYFIYTYHNGIYEDVRKCFPLNAMTDYHNDGIVCKGKIIAVKKIEENLHSVKVKLYLN